MPTWPTEAVEYGNFSWLRREVAPMLGLPNDVRLLDHVDRNRVDSVIDSALRLFYFPNPSQFTIADATEAQKERLRKAPHQWSFLQKSAVVPIVSGTAVYDLPADFSNFLDDPATSRSGERIAVVAASHLRQLLASAADVGAPKYAAVENKPHDGSSSRRSEVIFYPIPDGSENITIRYGISPSGLSVALPFPYGGQEHAETILACCSVVAAERSGGITETVQSRFADRMAASILMDAHNAQASTEGVWPVDEADIGLGVDRHYLGRLIGRDFGFGPNRHAWTYQQTQMVNEALRSGLRRFYNPQVLSGERYPHGWSFLVPLLELATVANQAVVQLPRSYTGLEGVGMTFADSASMLYNHQITYVGESQLRRHQSQATNQSGRPQFVAIRLSNVGDVPGTRYEAVFWPTPDAVYAIQFRARIDPVMLAMEEGVGVVGVLNVGTTTITADGGLVLLGGTQASDGATQPEGGQVHAQAIIESCLLACDELMKRDLRVRTERFREFLFASVGFDRKLGAPDSLGYNGDRGNTRNRMDHRPSWSNHIIRHGSEL